MMATKSKNLFYSVFAWMSLALVLSGITAYVIATHPAASALMLKPYIGLTALIVQLLIVVVFVGLLPRLSFGAALALFLFYSFLTGATISIIFKIYSLPSIIQTLFVTAGMFISMSVYGYITKADLSQLRSILIMGLWGMIIASIVNFFVKGTMLMLIISWVGVFLFSALTAYDVYMIKQYAMRIDNNESSAKVGLFGAFTLYLDFINLFLSLLNIMGKRRE